MGSEPFPLVENVSVSVPLKQMLLNSGVMDGAAFELPAALGLALGGLLGRCISGCVNTAVSNPATEFASAPAGPSI